MESQHAATPQALKCPQCGAALPLGAEGRALCAYCGSSLIWRGPGQETPHGESAVVRGVRLRPFVSVDHEGTGLEVFRLLIPAGWQVQGGVRWLLDNPGMPATVSFVVHNPQGAEAFEILPNLNLTWNNNPLARSLNPVGSRSFGAEVRPPMGIREAFRTLVLPRYRAVQGLQIVHDELVPDLPRLARSEAPLVGGTAEGGKVRILYTWRGVALEEELYGVVEVFRTLLPSMLGPSEFIYWLVDFLFSFRAAQGRLEPTADLFAMMIGSFRLNPHWYAAFKAVAQRLAQQQIQRIRHVGQIGQLLAQTGREIREQNLNDWYRRQEVYDRLNTDRSRVIRGVDGFYDPHRQEVVELPSGYGHAWANNLGEYIVTDSPSFDPNLDSTQHWEPMSPQ